MFCTNCGNKLESRARFCKNCGAEKISTAENQETVMSPPPQQYGYTFVPPPQPIAKETKIWKSIVAIAVAAILLIGGAVIGLMYVFNMGLFSSGDEEIVDETISVVTESEPEPEPEPEPESEPEPTVEADVYDTVRWITYTAAILIINNGGDIEYFGGVSPYDYDSLISVSLGLAISWNIFDRESAEEVIASVREVGHRTRFLEAARAPEMQVTPEEFEEYLASIQDLVRVSYLRNIFETYQEFGEHSLLAWDYGRIINILGWCYLVDIFTLEEALDIALELALELQEVYSSWDDFYRNFNAGFNFWNPGDVNDPTTDNHRRYMIWQEIKQIPDGPYSLPWNIRFVADWDSLQSAHQFTSEMVWGEGELSPEAVLDRVEVVYDLPELNLINHTLGRDSFFEIVPHESNLGNTYMILLPIEGIRDPEGTTTHDGPRIIFNVISNEGPDYFDAVTVLETWMMQILEDSYVLPAGPMRADRDRTIAVLPLRVRSVMEGEISRFLLAQVIPENNEIVLLNYFTWANCTDNFRYDRYAALVEFGELIGFEFIEYFDGTGIFDHRWFR